MRSQYRAALWMVGWAVSFSLTMIANRLASQELPIILVLWARCAVAFLVFLPFLRFPRPFHCFFLQLGRSLSIVGAMLGTYTAYRHLPMHTAAVLGMTTPFFIMIFAMIFLKESISWKRWGLLVLGGIGGVLTIIQPGQFQWNKGILISLMGNSCAGLAMVAARALIKKGADRRMILFYGTLTPLVVFTWFTPVSLTLSPKQWVTLSILGGCGALSQFCTVSALRLAPASFLAPFEYLRLCFLVIASYQIFSEVPSPWFYAGALLIVGASFILANLDRKSAFH